MESSVAAYAPGTPAADRAVTTYFYDELGRQEYVFGPVVTVNGDRVRQVTHTVYDDAHQGRRSQEVTNLHVPEMGGIADIDATKAHTTTYGYDDLGNVTSVTYTAAEHPGVSISTHSEYDALGHLVSETDALGRQKAFTYDPISGQLTQVTLPSVYDPISDDYQHPVYTYLYDDHGNLIRITDPLHHETHFTFNDNGQQTSRTLPIGLGPDGIKDTADDSTLPEGDFTERGRAV